MLNILWNTTCNTMHIAKANTVWHCYTKCRLGIYYGIITKHVDGVEVLVIKDSYATRKGAKLIAIKKCKQLAKEAT